MSTRHDRRLAVRVQVERECALLLERVDDVVGPAGGRSPHLGLALGRVAQVPHDEPAASASVPIELGEEAAAVDELAERHVQRVKHEAHVVLGHPK